MYKFELLLRKYCSTILYMLHLKNRIDLEYPETIFESIQYFGNYKFTEAREELDLHTHPGCFEICYRVSGSQIYSVGGENYLLTGNDIYITQPDELHSSGDYLQERGMLYWIQIRDPEVGKPFLALPYEIGMPLIQALKSVPHRLFRGDTNLKKLFDELMDLYLNYNSLTEIRIQNVVLQILLMVVSLSRKEQSSNRSNDIIKCINHIEKHLDSQLSVKELAKIAGLTESRFKAKFKLIIGIPPLEYMLKRKIEKAKTLLANKSMSVTDIAYALGFSSSQYFATTYKRFTRQTPSDFRRKY